MRTKSTVGAVVALQVALVGSVMFTGGCEKTTEAEKEAAVVTPMPPTEVEPAPAIAPAHPAPIDEGITGDTEDVKEAVPAPVKKVYKTYGVKSGDSLSLIAQMHGVRQKELLEINELKNPNKIKVGQKINLPAHAKYRQVARPVKKPAPTPAADVLGGPTGVAAPAAPEGTEYYTVAKGDVLSKIAVRFGTTSAKIRELNKLTGDMIRVNQKLLIPSRNAPVVAPVVPEASPIGLPAPVTPDAAQPGGSQALGTPAPQPVEGGSAAPTINPGAIEEPDAAVSDMPVTMQPYQTYTVLPGETLDSVANRWIVSVDKLMEINSLTTKDVAPGTVLKIPSNR